jgi:hypothetical protein
MWNIFIIVCSKNFDLTTGRPYDIKHESNLLAHKVNLISLLGSIKGTRFARSEDRIQNVRVLTATYFIMFKSKTVQVLIALTVFRKRRKDFSRSWLRTTP